MLDVYSGQPITMTVTKSNLLLKDYQLKQTADPKDKGRYAASMQMVESKGSTISLRLSKPDSRDEQMPIETRILEDNDIGYMMHPVGMHMTYNLPCITAMTQNIIEHLEDYSIEYSNVCFVGQGSSGCIIAALVASKIAGSVIWDIKKPGQSSHSHHQNWIPDPSKYLIFVDDFISSGKTFYRCYDEVTKLKRRIDCVVVSGRLSFVIFERHKVGVIICQKYNNRQELNIYNPLKICDKTKISFLNEYK